MRHARLRSFYRAVFLGIVLLSVSQPTIAQTDRLPAKAPIPERLDVDRLRYDPRQQGPLLFVTKDRWQWVYNARNAPIVKGMTPAQFAAQAERRVVTEGNLSAIVPRTMTVIAKNPGRPDPYAGMPFEERLRILLGTLSREQWKQAGSANGLGKGDMTEEQWSLLSGLFGGEAVQVQGNSWDGKVNRSVGEMETVAASDIRLRLSRQVRLYAPPVSEEGKGYMFEPYTHRMKPGESGSGGQAQIRYSLTYPANTGGVSDDATRTAFGVPVLIAVPNRLKTGQLPLDAPALSAAWVRLDGSHKTLGELLAAVAQATRLRLVADKRIAFLPVQYRLAPGGHNVSASDVLKILCRSVTGTFRRLDAPASGGPLFLLTDDVEGIGTRFARIARWGELAGHVAREAGRKAVDQASENDPLSAIGFAPDYPYTLGEDLLRRVDDGYKGKHKPGENETVAVSKLPPALREAFQEGLEDASKSGASGHRSDVVELHNTLTLDWLLPGGRTVPQGMDGVVGFDFLRGVALPRSARTIPTQSAVKRAPPDRLPANLKRRIFATSLPPTDKELRGLLELLTRKGFNEAWFRVEGGEPETLERFQQAVARGKAANVSVGVIIPWLRKKGYSAEESMGTADVNILNETGTELLEAKKLLVAASGGTWDKSGRWHEDRLKGWTVPDDDKIPAIVRRVASFLKVPGLADAAFTDTAAPGYDNAGRRGMSYPMTDRFGYSEAMRFRCVLEKGFDPIDVASHLQAVRIEPDLPFFRGEDVEQPLADFRQAQNDAHLARIHLALKAAFPKTRLLLNDGARNLVGFYGAWDNPKGFGDLGQRYFADVKRLRRTVLLASPQAPTGIIFTLRLDPNGLDSYFWKAWSEGSVEATKGWAGFCLDMGTSPLPDVVTLLEKLPDDAVTQK